jgi:hypothetical protein
MRQSSLSLIAHRPRQELTRAGRLSLDHRESWVLRWSIDGKDYSGEGAPPGGVGPG